MTVDQSQKIKFIPCHCWVTSETGLLKSINLAKKTATNFYPDKQPKVSDSLLAITNVSPSEVTGVTKTGIVQSFSEGEFKTEFSSGNPDPIFISKLSDSIVQSYKNGKIFSNDREVYAPDKEAVYQASCLLNQSSLVIGGKDVLPTLVDLEKGSTIWTGKNVAHSWLDIKQPIWQTSFVTDQENSGSVFYSTTAY